MMKANKNFMNEWVKALGYSLGYTSIIYAGVYAWDKWQKKQAIKKKQESNLEDKI